MFKALFNKLMNHDNSKKESASTVEEKVVAAPKPEPPKLTIFEFNVAGVTAKNENNKDIQKLLKQQGKRYAAENGIELYGGLKNKEIIEDDVEVSEFEDVEFSKEELLFIPDPTNEYDLNAIKVFIDFDGEQPLHVGYVPKNKNVAFKKILDHEDVRRIEAAYVGGKIKSVDYDDEKDKDVVITDELALGVEIKVFYKAT